MAQKSSDIDESRAVLQLLAALPVQPEATTSRVVINNPLLRVVELIDNWHVLTRDRCGASSLALPTSARLGVHVELHVAHS